jgi:hypothetical protein
VELVEDEQWGRVLVAQRDFAPGEVVIRSAALLEARSATEYMRACDALMQDGGGGHAAALMQFIEWATNSPRRVSSYNVCFADCISHGWMPLCS